MIRAYFCVRYILFRPSIVARRSLCYIQGGIMKARYVAHSHPHVELWWELGD
jgi:hypothetical protein